MVKLISLVLAVASLAACSPVDAVTDASVGDRFGLDKRQLADLLNLRATPVKKESLKPQLRPDAVRERLWFGPFTMKAYDPSAKPAPKSSPLQMDPSSTQLNKALSGFCTNCTVLYGKAGLMTEDGKKGDVTTGIYTHHVVMVDMSKRTTPFYICPGQKQFLGTFPAAGFIVSGNDEAANWFTTPDGKFSSGYAMGKSATVAMQAELVNLKRTPQKFYVTAETEYIKGTSMESDATTSLFSVTGCEFPDFHADSKKPVYNVTSALVPMPMDGYIINAKGHLHDGGVTTLLKLNNVTVCDSRALYGLDPKATEGLAPNGKKWEVITEMSQCTTPIPVRKGDMLQMVGVYDNVLHPPRHTGGEHGGEADEMGVFFVGFAAKKETLKKEGKVGPW